ncbi:MAG: presenilin family intramembrane aspartyl protease [Candidatus Caldarchaeum sp.]
MKEYLSKTYPVLLTLAMAVLFQLAVEEVSLPPPAVTPIPEEDGQDVSQLLTPTPYINTLIVVAFMFVGSLAIIMILRHRKVVRLLVLSVFFIAATAVTTFYLLILTDLNIDIVMGFAVAAALLTLAGILSRSEVAGLLASSYIASSSGVVVGSSIPFWTSLVLLVAISVYDSVAVFKGHLKTLGEVDISSIKGLVVDFRGVSIGLGDLFFYTVLYSFANTNFGILPATAAFIGIVAGYLMTLRLARERPVFPGLPITILTALIFSVTVYLLT